MGTFLVTGGAGFIGSHVVDELVAGGHDVRVVDQLDPAAHAGPPEYLNPGATYVLADIADADAWTHLLDGVDGVSHQAAKVGLGLDFRDVGAYVHANDVGTAALLRALHDRRWHGRLVLASSMVVYGEGRYTCVAHGEARPGPRAVADLESGRFDPPCPACGRPLDPLPVPETAPTDPRNVYAATKLHQEHLCAVFGRETGVPVTALRYHNVYGPRMPQRTPYAGVASIFRSACEAGQPPRVFEDGAQRRDFVHVRDVAHANVLALTVPEPVPGTFNVASGHPHTVLQMAAALVDAFGDGLPPPKLTGEYRLGDVRHVFASPARAAERLGFTAQVGFEEGMREFATAPLRRPPAGG
ncbi:MAG: NAD-dependent epimerase/dehydratase family protein [Egibacteraceae bacterium]